MLKVLFKSFFRISAAFSQIDLLLKLHKDKNRVDFPNRG